MNQIGDGRGSLIHFSHNAPVARLSNIKQTHLQQSKPPADYEHRAPARLSHPVETR